MIPRRYLAASALAEIALLVPALLWLTAADQRGGPTRTFRVETRHPGPERALSRAAPHVWSPASRHA